MGDMGAIGPSRGEEQPDELQWGSAVGFHSTETLLDSACRLYITALSGKASTGKFSGSRREEAFPAAGRVSVNTLSSPGCLRFHKGCCRAPGPPVDELLPV